MLYTEHKIGETLIPLTKYIWKIKHLGKKNAQKLKQTQKQNNLMKNEDNLGLSETKWTWWKLQCSL